MYNKLENNLLLFPIPKERKHNIKYAKPRLA